MTCVEQHHTCCSAQHRVHQQSFTATVQIRKLTNQLQRTSWLLQKTFDASHLQGSLATGVGISVTAVFLARAKWQLLQLKVHIALRI